MPPKRGNPWNPRCLFITQVHGKKISLFIDQRFNFLTFAHPDSWNFNFSTARANENQNHKDSITRLLFSFRDVARAPEKIRPDRRKTFGAYDGLNNILNLSYEVLQWKVHQALIRAKLETYRGFLHTLAEGKPSLICDFMELYRYLVEDFAIQFCMKLQKRFHNENRKLLNQQKRQERISWRLLDTHPIERTKRVLQDQSRNSQNQTRKKAGN